jgi:predicted nuclease of predicted toxin-antitoxin system
MRVLLDECLPRRLSRLLARHHVSTVPDKGWSGMKNGELLSLAEAQFDVFVTADQNLTYQQSLSGRSIAIIVLVAASNRFDALTPLIPRLEEALGEVQPGDLRWIRTDEVSA